MKLPHPTLVLVAAVAVLAIAATVRAQETAEKAWAEPVGVPFLDALLNADDVRSIHRAADGSMWVGYKGGGLYRYQGEDSIHHFGEEVGLAGVAAIFAGPGDDLWFTGPGGVTRFDGATWHRFREEMGRPVRVVFSGSVDSDGSAWFATNIGAVRYDGQTWEWTTTANGLRHDVVHDVHRDRSGNLWFATRRGGLSRLDSAGEWQHFHPEDNVRAIFEGAAGDLWFGTGGGGVLRFDGTLWTRKFATETVLPLFQDSRGAVWFSRDGAELLSYRQGSWRAHRSMVSSGEVQAAAESADGSLWLGASTGLHRYGPDQWGDDYPGAVDLEEGRGGSP